MSRFMPRWVALFTALATLLALSLSVAGAAEAKPRTANAVPTTISGTLADGTGAVAGTFNVQKFTANNGALTAVGTFTGTITDSAGTVLASGTNQPLALPVNLAQSTGSCQILDLVLGPLDLDLLGLMVHLDTVHLNITAQQGPGNLLGNLLCAVAGLLDGNTGLNALVQNIANLLNQLLAGL